MATPLSCYHSADVIALLQLHRELRREHPEIEGVWPFVPFEGPRFREGLRLLYVGKATEGRWGADDVREGTLQELQRQTDSFVLEHAGADYRSDFWSFILDLAPRVMRSCGRPLADESRRAILESIAWTNYLKLGQREGHPAPRSMSASDQYVVTC